MKKTRFSEEQMVKILREPAQPPVAEVIKKHGISTAVVLDRASRNSLFQNGG